jgi:predicted ATP-binding protein involved in virulence
MNIEKISVVNLFGNMNHEITLNTEGVTFIHGPNGCGKTTLLKMVHELLTGQIHTLKSIDFQRLEIVYSDETTLRVTQTARNVPNKQLFDDESDTVTDISIALLNPNGKEIQKFDYSHQMQSIKKADFPFPLSYIERRIPHLDRSGVNSWHDQRTGQFLSIEMVLEKYGDKLGLTNLYKRPSWLSERLDASKIGFVRTQRLIRMPLEAKPGRTDQTSEPREVVEIYSGKIKETIALQLAESAVQSQARDRSFPIRLIQKEFPKDVPQSEFLEKYRATEERAQNLMAAGLLDQAASIPLPKTKLSKMERDVLALYLTDFNEKLDAFTNLQKQIETFVEIVGSKLRRKKLVIDRQLGFVFETMDDSSRKLSVTDLSSGEQHQLVLFYELIFGSPGIDLFLIDEPEISLHVEWQRSFLSDLQKVQKLTGCRFLVATHSPQIINNRRDLAVALDGGVGD